MTKNQWGLIWQVVYPRLFIETEMLFFLICAFIAFWHKSFTNALLCYIVAQLVHVSWKARDVKSA